MSIWNWMSFQISSTESKIIKLCFWTVDGEKAPLKKKKKSIEKHLSCFNPATTNTWHIIKVRLVTPIQVYAYRHTGVCHLYTCVFLLTFCGGTLPQIHQNKISQMQRLLQQHPHNLSQKFSSNSAYSLQVCKQLFVTATSLWFINVGSFGVS